MPREGGGSRLRSSSQSLERTASALFGLLALGSGLNLPPTEGEEVVRSLCGKQVTRACFSGMLQGYRVTQERTNNIPFGSFLCSLFSWLPKVLTAITLVTITEHFATRAESQEKG